MRALADSIQEVMDLQVNFTATDSPAMRLRREKVMSWETSFVGLLPAESDDILAIKASNGAGNNAKVPWVRIFNPAQSPKTTEGWYVVLLIAADGHSACLSLNQGVTRLSRDDVDSRVVEARSILVQTNLANDLSRQSRASETIKLDRSGLGASYESGNLVAFVYESGGVPDDEVIQQDLAWLLERLELLPYFEENAHELGIEPGELTANRSDAALTCSKIYWDEEELYRTVESLIDESPQIILQGPPGTGKTFVAQHLAAYLLGQPGEVRDNPYIEVVQFHPSYGYEEFVEGLRPTASPAGVLEFKAFDGVLLRLADAINEDGMPRVLVIDEMNRANLPVVFGELMYLLEYREQSIHLMHRESFSLPSKLYIIGTMNTADRSIVHVDQALRRRFDFFDLNPNVEILRRHYAAGNVNKVGEGLFIGFEQLNTMLRSDLDRHNQVGHSYFMRPEMSYSRLRRVWERQVGQLIEDLLFDQPERLDDYKFERFWPND